MNTPICKNCEHCSNKGGGINATRSSFYCEHPDQKYIREFYEKHKIYRAHGFIDFSKPYEKEPAIKTSPKWCPKKKQGALCE